MDKYPYDVIKKTTTQHGIPTKQILNEVEM